MRIVSLLSGATEILFALGLGDQVVGVGHECDYPLAATTRPRLTICHLDISQTSDEIDREVKKRAAAGQSLYEIKRTELIALRPDLIVTQAQCDVCAVSYEDVVSIVTDSPELADTRIVALNPSTFSDVFSGIQSVADAANVTTDGQQLIVDLQTRLQRVETSHSATGQSATGQSATGESTTIRARVACIEWVEPLMFAGNWTPRLIELAGGESQLADANSPSEYSTLEDLLACDPDVIIVAPCGFGLERSLAETETLRKHPRWHELQAVRNRRVYVIDGNQYLNRSGPRLVDTVEILAKIIQDLPTENAIRLK